MDEYIKWLEDKIEATLKDKDLQREHWAFCKAYEALRQFGVIKSVCGDCWGSGWETQFVKPCTKCNGTGKC